MNKIRLSEVATVELSSIDKKIEASEIPVKLCNFTDVYYNWSITKNVVDACMDGSVNDTEYSKFSLKKGQVAITKDSETRDDIGMSTYISEDFDNAVLAYHCALITPKQGKVNGKYLNALFNDSYGRRYFANQASGSGQRYTLSKEAIESIEIPLPSIEKQNAIGSFFSNIDKKIELNNRINDNLLHQLKLLYDYWFTQFDFPDENGKPYRSSGGKMTWNTELNQFIPQNWQVGNLYQIADFINGLACQNHRPQAFEDSLPVIKIKEMHNGISEDTEKVSSAIPSKYVINDGDILFSWSASLEVIFWYGGTGCLNQHIFKVIPKNENTINYVYYQLSRYVDIFKKIAESRKTTMGHITTDHLQQSKIIIAPQNIINLFESKTQSMRAQIKNISGETLILRNMQQFLLPMLMNGQATISD